MNDELLAYLEADLVGAHPLPVGAGHLDDPAQVIARVAELANDEWSEGEAGIEARRLASAECLRAAQTLVLGALLRNPLVDVRGIRIARILRAALDEHRAGPLPGRRTVVTRRGLLARLARRR